METINTKRTKYITPELSPNTRLRTRSCLATVEDKDFALKVAETKANEDLDEIKTINSLMVAAEARTIRDQQLIENVEIKKREIEEKKRWDERLETNRLTALNLYDERERTLREQRIKGRRIIETQIEEHKINAILEAERKDRELKALMAQNAAIAEEERRILMEKKKRQQDFLHDCLQANEAQKRRRLEAREREKEEAQMVIEVAAQKALAEEALEAERAAQKALKEREIDSIRKKQQRAIDTKAMRDETMAIKVQKEKDQLAREREERDKKKIEDMKVIVAKERKEMIEIHKEMVEEQKRKDMEIHRQMMERNRIARQKAREEYQRKLAIDAEYRSELKDDMEARWEATRINPLKKIEEARVAREANEEYLAKIERLREEKLNKLRAKGVPDKYLVDIQALKWEIK
ncbi:nasopharyngeal epithelium specific protein [Tritrichomonas foetus]|uniref:Cilia- and flagella-associated protein 45 n=1 Tax=Tritrichomonas foetus TaxID=1144522 RepID=A0A1J4K1Y3_9EUKA|nr:nasopharyngeal epithelium specific protein [Tritrichomonas foetus]|eukprot:OHT03748.1 nasopharyngeal epithelium specific protein [Tritrichomonas foetus]